MSDSCPECGGRMGYERFNMDDCCSVCPDCWFGMSLFEREAYGAMHPHRPGMRECPRPPKYEGGGAPI